MATVVVWLGWPDRVDFDERIEKALASEVVETIFRIFLEALSVRLLGDVTHHSDHRMSLPVPHSSPDASKRPSTPHLSISCWVLGTGISCWVLGSEYW